MRESHLLSQISVLEADIQVRVDLLIQAPIYTIEDSLMYGTVLTIQTIRHDYPIRSKHNN